MNNSAPLLEVRDLAKRFGSVVALRSAALAVRRGEIHALMGANGAGKSTLVKILTGVFQADSGTITLDGVARSFRSPAEARGAGIVSVYQDPALVPDLTIAQNMRLADVDLNTVRGHFKDLGIADLSFGALTRDIPYPVLRLIDLARALASSPVVLMLDEITAALPTDLSERVFAVVRRWRERGSSVIFISHRIAEVSALCDRATVLRDGAFVGVTDAAQGNEDRNRFSDAGRGHRESGFRSRPRLGGSIAARLKSRRSRSAISAMATCSAMYPSAFGPERFSALRRLKDRGSGSCSIALPGCAARAAGRSWRAAES